MFGSEHKDHKFEHLEKVYNQHVKNIKDESGFIKERLTNYMKAMESIRKSIDNIQKAKETKEEELIRVMEILRNNLEKQLKEKLVLLLSEKSAIGNEITYLETLTETMESEINAASKSQLVKKSKELIKVVDEAKKRPTISFDAFNSSPEFT
jgi:tripartite motif-containing protein 37